MSLLTLLFKDLSETLQVYTCPVVQSFWGIWSWLFTATRPSATMLMSLVDGGLCWDSESHSIWGLKPRPEHKSLCGPDPLLGNTKSSTDGSARWENDPCISTHFYYSIIMLEKDEELTKNVACGVGLRGAGEALIHFAAETCVFLPVSWRNSEVWTDWMDTWSLRKMKIVFVKDVPAVGLKCDAQVTGGELCDHTLQHSSVSLQHIWERSPDLNQWSCSCRFWTTQMEKKLRFSF